MRVNKDMDKISPDLRSGLKALRPSIPSIDLEASSSVAERFQQKTLRPLLKFQNDLLVAAFETYAKAKKGVFFTLSGTERASYIEKCFRSDPNLRHFYMGMLVGHFTQEEYQSYLSGEKEIRKRALDLLIQRLKDQMIEA